MSVSDAPREDTMLRLNSLPGLMTTTLLFASVLITPGAGAEIKVLNANALTIAMKEIAADFTKQTGHTVTFVGTSPGLVDQRVAAGEQYDIIINATASVQAYEKEGRLRAGTRHAFARVGIGIAVREGTKVDISTVESTRQTLLDAKSIMHSDTNGGGLSGINAQKVLANLGVADAIKPKLKLSSGLDTGQALIAKGEIEIGIFNLSEIPRAPGVARAGPVPAAVQVYINYDSSVPATNSAPENALALIKFMTRAATRPVWDKAGLEAAGE
jgi:molybdate transport system substrate-binding protein